MARQIGSSESYIVTNSTARSIQKNWDQHTQGNYISNSNIDCIANMQIKSGYGRKVHGNAKGEKF
ncbi:Acot12 [Acrasis kona]|uniref:Acot12 n=1 Tax=Acrasis kona TaxID=1008807 RepID=A0AAW2YTK1_9EUKA